MSEDFNQEIDRILPRWHPIPMVPQEVCYPKLSSSIIDWTSLCMTKHIPWKRAYILTDRHSLWLFCLSSWFKLCYFGWPTYCYKIVAWLFFKILILLLLMSLMSFRKRQYLLQGSCLRVLQSQHRRTRPPPLRRVSLLEWGNSSWNSSMKVSMSNEACTPSID